MPRRSLELPWKTLLIAIALAAAALALYLHLFELRSRQQAARLASSRLERAVDDARVRLKAEILAELRAGSARADPDTQPLPGTVLRRREPGPDAPSALGQSFDPLAPDGSPTLAARIAALSARLEESERTLRRDLDDLRATTESAAEVAHQVTSLVLVALIALAGALLVPSPRPPIGT